MDGQATYDKLLAVLREAGIRTVSDRNDAVETGFPLTVPLQDGGSLVLDLPYPGFIASLDPDGLGVAILDSLGYVRRTWGIARRVPFFKQGASVLESPIGGLLEGSSQGGHGALYLDGFRYFSAGVASGAGTDIVVLVVNSQDEKQARRQASRNWRTASALKRLGKALTMNHTTQPLCVAAAHEVASTAELAAVLLWVHRPETDSLELAASVGANRLGSNALHRLSTTSSAGCAAELVASTRQAFTLSNVLDHILTANLEAKFCYLKPGGMAVYPLVISDRLLGVLELVGREGDTSFAENGDLFETIAEHLALALNSAAMFEQAERLASHDALTGLANHRCLQEFLHARVSEGVRMSQPIGVIMIDVDHFRSFNEEEGHDVGDEVLKQVGESIRSCLRPYDLAARYGGEEFTVVMPGSSQAGVVAAAERIRAKVEEAPFITRSGRERHVTISLGCSICPDNADDPSSLIKTADSALFEAKRSGRNRVVVFQGVKPEGERPKATSLDQIDNWMSDEEKPAAEDRIRRFRAELDALSLSLHLSEAQLAILEALLRFVPTYRRLIASLTEAELEALEKAEEFRLLLPSLHTMDERYDGAGPGGVLGQKIPLLARVLSVLMALEDHDGAALIEDSARFDPEIVGLLSNLDQAAA